MTKARHLRYISSGSPKRLANKEYTIGVPISLGNKWFTPQNVKAQVDWAKQFSKGPVVVYVADTIHAYNVMARDSVSNYNAALRKAKRIGDKILYESMKLIDDPKVEYRRWDEIEPKLAEDVRITREFAVNCEEFAADLEQTVQEVIKGEKRNFSQDKLDLFAEYLIAELPENLNSYHIGGVKVTAWIYPTVGIMPFFEGIPQKYPRLARKIMHDPKAFAVPRIEENKEYFGH